MWRLTKNLALGRRYLHVGEKIAGWTVKEVASIQEFDMTVARLKHKSGSEVLNLCRPDPNATFSVGFRTIPTDSTGLPHILEHTVLCGSQRYPCHDPFFNMKNRSLATFMNAMTAPDHTFYPFSSQNSQDFKNLQSVYLDAVFKPRLAKLDFRREGWRLENQDPNNVSSDITLKGVVFNEMKGVFSDNQNLFAEALLNSMLPSHTYGVCSGGDPLDIPTLRHEDLIKFHKTHYTPGNARFYLYGNLPIESQLEAIAPYLEQEGGPAAEVPCESRWNEPRRNHVSCRNDPMSANPEKQSSICVSYLCCDIRDTYETFVLTLLSELLVKGPNAVFYRTLVEPAIGAGLSPVTGYERQTRDTFFSVGLQGVSPNDFDKVEKIIEETFDEAVKEGFPPERVESILHGFELSLKHQSANFGLGVLFAITSLWNHNGDVINALKIEQQIAKLRAHIKEDPQYLQKKLKQYFVNNNHRLTLTMSPDDKFEEELKRKEDALLAEKITNLSDADRQKVYEEGLELLKSKDKDNKHVLPTLTVADIPEDIDRVPVEQSKIGDVPVSIFRQPTNGVTYFRALLPTEKLPQHLHPYLPLFAHVSTKMGTKKRSFRDLDQEMSLRTGGLDASCLVAEDAKGNGVEGSLVLSSHCLDRNIPYMFSLWEEVLGDLDLEDSGRFETLVKAAAADMVNSVAGAGHHYAMLAASSLVSESAKQEEEYGGLTFLKLLKEVAGGDTDKALANIRELSTSLTNGRIRCSVNTLPGTKLTGLDQLISNLGLVGCERSLRPLTQPASSHLGRFHLLPSDVSYTSKAVPTVSYTHPDFAPLRVLSRFITSQYLHPEVREKGGAYGGGVTISNTGLIRYYSYRDPSPENSFRVFDETSDWLLKNPPKKTDLEEAKLGVFQSVDAPVSPGQRGSSLFLYGISDDMKQEHRILLKAVTVADVLRVADSYLAKPSVTGRCLLGPENKTITEDSSCQWVHVET